MIRKLRYCLTNCRGQAMVEFALILPVFLLLLMGMVEFGRVYNETLIVTAAAREGARVASIKGDWATAAKNAAATINRGKLTSTINTAPVSGQNITVTVTNEVDIITPLIQVFFGGQKYVAKGKATMRVE